MNVVLSAQIFTTDHEMKINIDRYYKDFYLLFDKMIWKIMQK